MPKPVLRGLIIVAFFALTAFVLVPAFVPRPAFIPGFAPPPDMWPRTVSLAGIALGALALLFAVTRPQADEPPLETDGSSPARMAGRFAGLTLEGNSLETARCATISTIGDFAVGVVDLQNGIKSRVGSYLNGGLTGR